MICIGNLRWCIPFELPHSPDEQVWFDVMAECRAEGPGRRQQRRAVGAGEGGQAGGRGQGARGQQQEADDSYHDGVISSATVRLGFLRCVCRIYLGKPVLSVYTVLQKEQESFSII